jgi:hypothetical protein
LAAQFRHAAYIAELNLAGTAIVVASATVANLAVGIKNLEDFLVGGGGGLLKIGVDATEFALPGRKS